MEKHVKRILITGASGFIGGTLFKKLSGAGYDVWGIDKEKGGHERIFQADLLSYESTRNVFSGMPDFDVVIHAAALAHFEKGQQEDLFYVNSTITQNLVRIVKERPAEPHVIFLSSVAVYGEAGRNDPVSITEELRPSTEYGRSKVDCEQAIRGSGFQQCHILRLTPVFDEGHTKDIKKRVYIPGQSRVKMRIIPAPKYHFCHVDTLSTLIFELVEDGDLKFSVMNVADQKIYDQNRLIERFPGSTIFYPVVALMPIYYVSFLFFPKTGYKFRCLFWKLFKNNLYEQS